MSNEKKGMFSDLTVKDWIIGLFTGFLWIFYKMYKNDIFSGLTVKDWLIGFFTGWLWILYKMHKNGISIVKPIGKIVGVYIVLAILIVSLSDELSYKNIKLGMNKQDISSKIKLVENGLFRKYDNSYTYIDGNNNKILIDGINFEVSFVIRGDNNLVRSIIFNAKDTKNITENQLLEISKKLTDKTLEKRTVNNYSNGKLSTIIFEHSEIRNGIEDDFQIIYSNENALSEKNQIQIIHALRDKAKEKMESDANLKVLQAGLEATMKVNKISYTAYVGCKTGNVEQPTFTCIDKIKIDGKYNDEFRKYPTMDATSFKLNEHFSIEVEGEKSPHIKYIKIVNMNNQEVYYKEDINDYAYFNVKN